jgi:CubicO group peptidase (beta-lactamase class C family)
MMSQSEGGAGGFAGGFACAKVPADKISTLLALESGGTMNRADHVAVRLTLLLTAAVAGADEIDDFVREAMQKHHIPGVSLAVVKDGALVKAEGYGLANLEHEIPVRPDTVFKIGSVSKQFIATGIMLLVQDGRIALDDHVSAFLPDAPESWQTVTIRHLLTHTTGIVREAPGFTPYKLQPDIDVIRTAYALPLRFEPGEKWEYCNVGYFILGEIIHVVSGKPWGDFLSERVFAPAGMMATRVTSAADIVPGRSHGYAWKADRFQNAENFLAVRPSGAFLSTVLDLAKWEEVLLTNRVLSQSAKTLMWTAVVLNDGRKYAYGFGWQLDDFPAGSEAANRIAMMRHGGTMPGFRAGYFRWPNHGLAVVVLTNAGDVPIDGLGAGIAVRAAPELKLALQTQAASDQREIR